MVTRFDKIEWKKPSDRKPWEVVSNRDYAEIAQSLWRPSKEITDALRPVLPTSRDYAGVLRHELPGRIELSPQPAPQGRHYIDAIDPGQMWDRSKHYMIAYVDYDAVMSGDTDAVRAACFDATRLLAKRIGSDADLVTERCSPPRGASVDYTTAIPKRPWPCTKIMFIGGHPIHYPVGHYNDEAFIAFDEMSDRVMIPMASYYFAVPA